MTTKKGTEVAVQAPDNSVAAMIRLALDNKADPDALTKLVDLHDRVEAKRAEAEFTSALAKFQATCPAVFKNTRGNRNTYATLDHLVQTIRPHLDANGLSFTFDTEIVPGAVTVVTILRHSSGHKERSTFTCPIDQTTKMSDTHKMASGNSYAKRYGLANALGLTFTDEDDDGVDAGSGPTISAEDVAHLEDGIKQVGARRDDFLRFLGVSDLAELPASKYQRAVDALRAKARKNGGAS